MSYQLTHHQTETTPAEYQAGNPFTCCRCGWEGDRDEDTVYDAADGPTCRECIHRCNECRVLLEGADAESDPLPFGRENFCESCFPNLLCPDWVIENGKVRWV